MLFWVQLQKLNRKQLVQIFKTSFKDWLTQNSPINAAALTFFIILPLPSLLLIVVTVFAQFYGQTQAEQQLIQQITAFAGPAVAQLFKDLLQSTYSPFTSVWASITLIAFTLGGAIGAFAVLRDVMDVIWNVKVPKKQKLTMQIREKIGPFAVVSALGLVVIAWTTVAETLRNVIVLYSINSTLTAIALTIAQILVSFAVATVLFAITYKLIPQAKVHWQDVELAAVTTGIAFTVVNYILGFYIQTFTITTITGAAGSLIIILLWIYILNQIVLFGAEISRAYVMVRSYTQQRLPEAAERIIRELEKAGKKVEEAAKGQIAESWEETEKMPETKEALNHAETALEKKEEKAEPETTQATEAPPESKPASQTSGFVVSFRMKKSNDEEKA
jgi:membrane protein